MTPDLSTPIRVGVFQDLEQADLAVAALIDGGFPKDQISVVCPERAQDVFPDGVNKQDPAGSSTPEAIVAGGAIGATLGSLAAVTGLAATGGVAIFAIGPLLGGVGAGALAGGFVGAMTTRGFEPEIADYYDQSLRKGSVLVAVDVSSQGIPGPHTAEQIFKNHGAEPVPLREG